MYKKLGMVHISTIILNTKIDLCKVGLFQGPLSFTVGLEG